MGLTVAQANSRLSKINTPEALRNLIKEIDARGVGQETLLWSGIAGYYGTNSKELITSEKVATSLQRAVPRIRTIATTEVARFLDLNIESPAYNQRLNDKLLSIFDGNQKEINNFLYGALEGNPRKRISKGIWDDVSENFVRQATGNVRLVVGGAGLDRVFAQTEIHALLANPAIRSVEGVPIEGLRALARTSGVNRVLQLLMGLSEANTGMLRLPVDSAGRPVVNADGTFRLDATDYMRMNTLNTSQPPGMRSVMEFIPDERRLRHFQAVEEIFKLHPILRGQNYALPIDTDPFRHRTAIARVATHAGRIADVHSMTTMLAEAGWQLHRGDHRGAHNTITSWVAENAGGLAAGRLATLLVAPLMATGPVGMIIGAGIIIGSSLGGAELAKQLHRKVRDGFRRIDEQVSPLVLDLDGNGIQTLALAHTAITFDHDSNGFAERTGWVAPNDGLLVLDLNRNGRIDNGTELFGNHSRLADGSRAANGFQALARYDNNNDGRIDNQDPIWGQLRVWRDLNSNGNTEPRELSGLGGLHIQALELQYTSSSELDSNGNTHREKGQYQLRNGQRAALTDVWFATDTLNSRQIFRVPVDLRTAALPNLAGMGIVPSLHQALMTQGGLALRRTLMQWIEGTRQQQMDLRETLLLQWCGAGRNPFTSPTREFDSEDSLIKEKVAVVEKLMGQAIPDTEDFFPALKGQLVVDLVKELALLVEMVLWEQVHVAPLFRVAVPVETTDLGTMQLDVSAAVDQLRRQFAKDPDPSFVPMIQWQLAQRGPGGLAFFNSLRREAMGRADALGLAMRQHRSVSQASAWISGTSMHDVLRGSGQDDILEGGASYDLLDGQEGNDILIGGPGSDFYHGGAGADTYSISQNGSTSHDTVFDASSPLGQPDRVVFADISSTDVRVVRQWDNVSFHSGQQLLATIEQQMSPLHRIEEFHFADGAVWEHNTIFHQPIRGTAGDDRLIAPSHASHRLFGLSGNDILCGSPLADHLEGNQGHDVLTGLAGQDILDGGEGNDSLEGGEGGDRYLFGANGGHDRIQDGDQGTGESDRVVFTNLVSSAITHVQSSGHDLQLQFGPTTSLTLVNQLQPFSRIEELQFADGTIWDHGTLLRQVG